MNYLIALLLLLLYGCKATITSEVAAATETPKLSIRLCCQPSELLNTRSFQCAPIPPDFNVTSWNVSNFWSDGNAEKVNILDDLNYNVENVACEKPYVHQFFQYSNDTEHCYTPHYHNELEKYIIATVYCAYIIQVYFYIYDTYLIAIGISTLFLILTILVYGLLKELRHTLHWKMFLCHFVSLLGSHIFVLLSARLVCIDLVLYVWIFFVSSRLWLNVIGYEIWSCLYTVFGSTELSRTRFACYSVYVWGLSIAASLSSWYLKDSKPMDTLASFIPIVLLLIWTLMGFGYFAFKIWQKRYLRKSLLTVLCLLYLMVLPWIMLLTWLIYYKNVYIAVIFYIYLISEGPIMFALFVPARKLRFLWGKKTSGRNTHSKVPKMPEEVNVCETVH